MPFRKVSKQKAAMTAAAIAAMFAISGIRTTSVSAQTPEAFSTPELIRLTSADASVSDVLKNRLISDRVSFDPSLSADSIDAAASRIEISGLDSSRKGLQTVHANVSLSTADKNSEQTELPLAYSFTETRVILTEPEQAPEIRLKSDRITVNNGDSWNPFCGISYINDDSGVLPAVIVSGNVDMNTDGTYPVTYSAVDQLGNRTSVRLLVDVTTPQEVIAAREEAERLAREQAEAEEAARQEAERQAREEAERQREQQLAAIEAAYSYAGGSATGNAIADAARAWKGVGYYVWGGANPATGADCSGFTQYIFSQFGISLAHNNLAQAAAGYQVSAADARPGDIVVWDNHVGIYTGGGYYVSAMSPELGILEIPISASRGSGSYWGIYRIYGVN